MNLGYLFLAISTMEEVLSAYYHLQKSLGDMFVQPDALCCQLCKLVHHQTVVVLYMDMLNPRIEHQLLERLKLMRRRILDASSNIVIMPAVIQKDHHIFPLRISKI